MTNPIKTYDTERFRERFIRTGKELDALMKADFGRFFIVRVEEMIRLMKLPVPPARTTTHTLIYLKDGYAEMTVGNDRYRVLKDECLIVPAGQVFSIGNVDVDSGCGYLCNFHNDIVTGGFGKSEVLRDFEFLHAWGNPRIVLGEQVSRFVLNLAERLHAGYSETGLKNPDIIRSYLAALLCEINSVYRPLSGSGRSSAAVITNRFKELIFSNGPVKRSVSDYAGELCVSPNHLNKCVKSVTGKAAGKWIDEAAILEAKVLLCQTGLSVSEIAASLGILDQSYFSRLFRKYEGCTPLEFRKRIEKS